MNKKYGVAVILCVAITMFSSWSYVKQRTADGPLTVADIEKPIVVIIPSYNNIQWYKKNIDSVLMQEYKNYSVIYVDDASRDGTGLAVQEYVKQHDPDHKITVICNPENKGAMANIYYAVHSVPDDAIVITLDGDDWLAHERVFETINNAYADSQVWMSYGNYTHYPDQPAKSCCAPIPAQVVEQHAYRRYQWCTSHLRTFYAWLFKKIKKEDLCDAAGFYRVTWDQAFLFPMLEMAAGRWRYIPEILYVYNVQNPLNDFKVRLREQLLTERAIRAKKPYEALS
jgi:glycosyltransferase involved in cell wall biosynthesis